MIFITWFFDLVIDLIILNLKYKECMDFLNIYNYIILNIYNYTYFYNDFLFFLKIENLIIELSMVAKILKITIVFL